MLNAMCPFFFVLFATTRALDESKAPVAHVKAQEEYVNVHFDKSVGLHHPRTRSTWPKAESHAAPAILPCYPWSTRRSEYSRRKD